MVFPRLNLTDTEQLAFTDKLGKRLNYNRKAPGSGADGEEDVYTITLDKKINFQPEYVLGTFFWHIDGVTINQPLASKATLLSARKLSLQPAGRPNSPAPMRPTRTFPRPKRTSSRSSRSSTKWKPACARCSSP